MISTSAATSVQLARAKVISKALTRTGWTSRRVPDGEHPGAVGAASHVRGGASVLVLTLGGRYGQMVEILADAVPKATADGGRRTIPGRPSWRLTAYDAPAEAVVAAAQAAYAPATEANSRWADGWTVEHAPAHARGRNVPNIVRATQFIRPDDAVIATFRTPTYSPPCETCAHAGDLGDAGGWLITGPGFTAEATAHTPTDVIAAFTRALPGSASARSDTSPGKKSDKPRRRAESGLAAATVGAPRVVEVVV